MGMWEDGLLPSNHGIFVIASMPHEDPRLEISDMKDTVNWPPFGAPLDANGGLAGC